MSYKVKILKGALKQLKKLSPELQERIQIKIDDLAIEPRFNRAKKLKGQENPYRIRVGEYRVIYDVFDDVLLVNVVEIGHRRSSHRLLPCLGRAPKEELPEAFQRHHRGRRTK